MMNVEKMWRNIKLCPGRGRDHWTFQLKQESRCDVSFCAPAELVKEGLIQDCNRVAALTEQPLVILRFSFEQAVNPLDWAKLYFHVCQVTHHPVHVVGYLIHGGGRSGDKLGKCHCRHTHGACGTQGNESSHATNTNIQSLIYHIFSLFIIHIYNKQLCFQLRDDGLCNIINSSDYLKMLKWPDVETHGFHWT